MIRVFRGRTYWILILPSLPNHRTPFRRAQESRTNAFGELRESGSQRAVDNRLPQDSYLTDRLEKARVSYAHCPHGALGVLAYLRLLISNRCGGAVEAWKLLMAI